MTEQQFLDKGCYIDDTLFIADEENLTVWIETHASDDMLLLAHADDGVIWGKLENGSLITSTSNEADSHICPPLRRDTLQQLRLFNKNREIRLWRTSKGFSVVSIQDSDPSEQYPLALDEDHLLWGTQAQKYGENFMLMEDGEQGLRHIIPNINGLEDKQILLKERLYLQVRHYIKETNDGVNTIGVSRLVKLGVKSHGAS